MIRAEIECARLRGAKRPAYNFKTEARLNLSY